LVSHFTGKVKARLGSIDEELYERILFTNQDPKFRNKIDTFAQFLTETIAEALERINEYMRAEFL
jgi:hypothetical protein